MAQPKINWHAMPPGRVAELLQTDAAAGLAPEEAQARLARQGRNVLPEEKKKTLLAMFVDQFKDFLVLILVAAAVVSVAMGETTDALVIIAILVLNAVLGVTQEHKAGRALEALKKLSVPECEVIRGGRRRQTTCLQTLRAKQGHASSVTMPPAGFRWESARTPRPRRVMPQLCAPGLAPAVRRGSIRRTMLFQPPTPCSRRGLVTAPRRT